MRAWTAAVMGAALVVAGVMVAPAATASDTANADGTQPVLATDNYHTCAIRENGVVYCWGENNLGQLGRGNASVSLLVLPITAPQSSLALAVDAGGETTCAIMLNRTLKCWGSGAAGKRGSGNTDSSGTPTAVTGLTNVATVGVGANNVCVSRQDGSVWCWGLGTHRMFPGAGTGNRLVPEKVAGLSNVVSVSVGSQHACAVRADKKVLCWGNNDYGQLGDGSTSVRSAPVQVKGITDAIGAAAGSLASCVLRVGGTVSCWGSNQDGHLGARYTSALASSPQTVYRVSGATSLGMGIGGGCVVISGGTKCWGAGPTGRLGDSQTYDAYAPVTATAGLAKATSVSTSHLGSCQVADGRVWCWGNGAAGRLGNESTSNVPTGTGPANRFGFAETPTKIRIVNTAPGKPTATSPATRKAKLTWTAPSTSNGTSAPTDYVVQYRLKGTTAWKTFNDGVNTKRTVTVTGLTKGKQYAFRILPKNWAGTGTASALSATIKIK